MTSGSGDRPRKEGSHGGGVYSFSPGKQPKCPKVLTEGAKGAFLPAEPLGFCMRVLQGVFYYARGSAEPSCRTPKVLQNSGGVWETGPSFEAGFVLLKIKVFAK